MLSIFYLTNEDRHFTFQHYINLINKSQRKPKWRLLVLTHSHDQQFYYDILKKTDISYNIIYIPPHDNYMEKVRFAIQDAEYNKCEYMMKCDNDILLTPQALDYIVDNLNILDNPKNITLGPTLTSGIPSAEYFIQSFLTEEQQEIIHKKFLETNFGYVGGLDYSMLNRHTLGSSKWNKEEFFFDVKYKFNHYYKGIHPIRVSTDAITYLNNCIIENKDKFFNTDPTGLIYDTSSPYLCDSIFCIKRETYKSIINDHSLFVDPFDEVPLNKYAWKHECAHVFVENGYAIHPMYNWTSDHKLYEHIFCERLFT